MAPWALTKLLHPFTPEDILVSQQLVSPLKLPASTSQFVLALTDPRSKKDVVYVLAVEKLSERSIGDIDALVSAVNPRAVVAFVDAQGVGDVLAESDLLDAPEASLDVPTSAADVLKTCFSERIKGSAFENRAGLRVLISVFGTTFYGNVFAAKKAAGKTQAVFECLKYPSVGGSFLSDEEEVEGGVGDREAEDSFRTKLSIADRFLGSFSGLLGGNDVDYLTGFSKRTGLVSRSIYYSPEFKALAPSIASNVAGDVTTSSAGSEVPSSSSEEREESPEDADNTFPSFAAPFYPLFVDLHNLFKETLGVNHALYYFRKLLNSVESGNDVDDNDLSQARLFRVAVESVRLCWNSATLRERMASFQLADFDQLPVEEKCQALLARALQLQAQKFCTVVAVVDASSVPGIRKHWNTPIPPEVAAYAEYCVVGLDSDDTDGSKTFKGAAMENLETKAAVVVSAGAVAAGLFSLPQWASVPTFMKIFSFKVPTALKVVWLQMKRQAVVSWGSAAAAPASKAIIPALKAAGSGKAVLAPSSAAKAVILKSVTSAERARAAAQTMVVAAERASLRAVRTAFYSLMRNRQTKTLGARPWFMLGGTLLATAGVIRYADEVEGALGIAPSIPAVVKLGRGLENLDRASQVVADRDGARWWDHVYDSLYRRPRQL